MTTVLPYGDEPGDGVVQISFTLPLPHSSNSTACAERMVRSWGFGSVQVVHARSLGHEFTLYIVYARTTVGADPTVVEAVPEPEVRSMSFDEVNGRILKALRRQLVVVGAATGSDAHTVGLDSILSMKGRSGDHGLERYPALRIVNLGSQVSATQLADTVGEEPADVVLVSQVVTQRGVHERHFRAVHGELVTRGLRDRVVLIGGGPGVTMADAPRMGYDAMFGRGTRPLDVATYLASRFGTD
jgi:beta-lysine 5,6-aminomutase beta subunit